MTLEPLPIDDHVEAIRRRLGQRRAVVISAAPGAGKTTRVPPALLDVGPVILLQPRRVAARAVTSRIAEERGWTIGREVGWQIRFERRFSRETKLLLVTEGILTARLQHDPLLSEFATVIFDEFHERSVHADLGLALTRQAWMARDDLRIVVMSATLETSGVAAFLDGCEVVDVPGRLHPNTIEYAPGETVARAVAEVLPRSRNHVLCFLAGSREIQRAMEELTPQLDARGVEVVPLHGSLSGDAQDAALRPTDTRRVILSTNIAETSLTVPGVSTVVDTGFHKVARYDSTKGVDSLSLERIASDSADQRAGRAARLGPGLVRRLWDARQRLDPRGEPEIARVDLAGPILDLLAWGADVDKFEWFEAPAPSRVCDVLRLLHRLGAVSSENRLTTLGRQMQRIPAHPRLARILIDADAAPDAAALCAELGGDPRGVDQLRRITAEATGRAAAGGRDDERLRRAVFAGYADRLARRRHDAPDRFLLASGHGAVLAHEAAAAASDFIVALEVVAAARSGVAEARIRSALPVDSDWITATSTAVEHSYDRASGRVRATRVSRFDAIVLEEHPVAPEPAVKAQLLAEEWLQRGPDPAATQLRRRARFAGVELDISALVAGAAVTANSVRDIDLASQLPYETRRTIDAGAPASLPVPSGRSAPLEYQDDGTVAASVKLQELFGLADSPLLGPTRVPVTFHLLAPNGRPVQTTRDLRSFWERTYPEVRKELRGRYPKHPWPEDPWTATATHRTTKRVAK